MPHTHTPRTTKDGDDVFIVARRLLLVGRPTDRNRATTTTSTTTAGHWRENANGLCKIVRIYTRFHIFPLCLTGMLIRAHVCRAVAAGNFDKLLELDVEIFVLVILHSFFVVGGGFCRRLGRKTRHEAAVHKSCRHFQFAFFRKTHTHTHIVHYHIFKTM